MLVSGCLVQCSAERHGSVQLHSSSTDVQLHALGFGQFSDRAMSGFTFRNYLIINIKIIKITKVRRDHTA